MPEELPPYWFHAKPYGYGWGLPARREGWIVMIAWVVLAMGAGPFIAVRSIVVFCIYMLILAAVLIGICYVKGEPPRWRWGK